MRSHGERRCYIHIGTHKTGSTYLQQTFARNADRFAEAGILIPRTGRPHGPGESELIGNHNVAWQLSEIPRFHPSFGTLADLKAELSASHLQHAIVSSEDFALVYDKPAKLEALCDTCVAAGYRPTIIVYLRDQASYAQSLYAMWVVNEGMAIAFETLYSYIAQIAMLGWGIGRLPFQYDKLIAPFVRQFGHDRVVVRAYRGDLEPEFLLRDFLSLFDTPPLIEADRTSTGSLPNKTASSLEVMSALHRKAGKGKIGPLDIAARENFARNALERPFVGVGPRLLQRFVEQFSTSNARVEGRYGVELRRFTPPDAATWEAQVEFLQACSREWNLV